MIPKIIHQIAPSDKTKWHPKWKECRESFKEKFSDHKIFLWYDTTPESFAKKYYPRFYDLVKGYPFMINKLDIFRIMLLHRYGGIYADMDVECHENFYEKLPDGFSTLQENQDTKFSFINCMMSSNKNNTTLLKVLENAKFIWKTATLSRRVLELNRENNPIKPNIARHVLLTTGSPILEKYKNEINTLSTEEFKDYITHYMTTWWK
jgi:mannosyltransferase OCH1-like enzyme